MNIKIPTIAAILRICSSLASGRGYKDIVASSDHQFQDILQKFIIF